MGGGLLQLVCYGAPDIYLTGNPENGEPFWGYRSKCTLYSNPYCPSLEYSHLSNGTKSLKSRRTRENDGYNYSFNKNEILPKTLVINKNNIELEKIINLYCEKKNIERQLQTIETTYLSKTKNIDNTEIEESMVTQDSINMFRQEMMSKKIKV